MRRSATLDTIRASAEHLFGLVPESKLTPLYGVVQPGTKPICGCYLGSNCPDRNRAKHPHTSRKKTSQTFFTTLDELTEYAKATSWAMTSGNLGWWLPRGYTALDIDRENKHGNGLQTAEDLQARYGKLPDTLTAISGSGDSWHLIYTIPEDAVLTKANTPGWDIKGSDTGYIVVAPSLHIETMQPYRWLNELPIASLPPVWVDALSSSWPPDGQRSLPDDWTPSQEAQNAAEAFVLRQQAEAIAQKTDTGKLYRFAWSVGRNAHELPRMFVSNVIRETALAFGKDITQDAHVRRKLRASYDKGRQTPYVPPPPSNELPKWLRRD